MDVNDEHEESQESDSEMIPEDLVSNMTPTTISPVSTPDSEMSEAASTIGQDISSTDLEKIQNEVLPSKESESYPDDCNILLNKIDGRNLHRETIAESIAGDGMNQNSIKEDIVSTIVTTDELSATENHIDHDEISYHVPHDLCSEVTDLKPFTGEAVPDADGFTIENQIPLNGPNSNTHFVETTNDANFPTDDNRIEAPDQSLVADESRSTATVSDQPIDGNFQVLQI